MASRQTLAAVVAALQLTATSGAGWGVRGAGWRLRGGEDGDQVAFQQVEQQAELEQPNFLERNLPWLAPLPYLEGRAASLVLSKVFPDKVEPVQVPKRVEVEVPKVQPLPGSEQIESSKTKEMRDFEAAHAPKNPLVNKQGNVEVDADKLAASHPVVDKDGKPRDHTAVIAAAVSSASTVVLWLIFVLSAAAIYRNTKDASLVDFEVAKAKGDFKDQDFKHHIFDCFSDMDVCCWSFWCGGVQWADSIGAVGSLPFWAGLALFFVLGSFNFVFGLLAWPLVALVFAYYRQDLRRKFELQNEGSDMAKDFALWCCCSCCAIVQEARQVKEARQLAA